MKKKGLIIVLLCFITLMGCSHKSPTSAAQANDKNSQPTYLYQNKSKTISIKTISGWTQDFKLSASSSQNIVFTNGKLKAIVAMSSGKDSFTDIKNNLKASSPHSKVIKEKPSFLSFKTLNKESIETDVYLQKKNNRNYIIIFMMPSIQAHADQGKIKLFLSNIKI